MTWDCRVKNSRNSSATAATIAARQIIKLFWLIAYSFCRERVRDLTLNLNKNRSVQSAIKDMLRLYKKLKLYHGEGNYFINSLAISAGISVDNSRQKLFVDWKKMWEKCWAAQRDEWTLNATAADVHNRSLIN